MNWLGLFFSGPASFQIQGKLNIGILLIVAKLCGGIYNKSAFRKALSGCLSLLVIQRLWKEIGSVLWKKLCMNFNICSLIRWSRGRIDNCANNGAVWSRKPALLIILIASFCLVAIAWLINLSVLVYQESLGMSSTFLLINLILISNKLNIDY